LVKPRPGQTDLFGGEQPPEQADRHLVNAGFKPFTDQGVVMYADPFVRQRPLTRAATHRLLDMRMEIVPSGWRVRYPEGRTVGARFGPRRAAQEGAWHELRLFLGESIAPPPEGFWIVDSDGRRVWPTATGPDEPSQPPE
jgi:hypothetical protein